ncbi:MAG: cytochrome c [Betaproteobacteria bacterium]|nr:MAG: cytochrome c [Betaproteobacteria bacterium]
MNRWIKRGLIALVVLALLAGALLFTGLQMEQRKRDRRVAVPAYSLAQADDAQALERGKYLFSSRGCAECHGANGAGHVFIDSGGLRAKSPNISSGAGGVVGSYGVVDWERTIRHGVKPDGRPVFIMPSEDYNRLTDADVAALVAYARSLPPAQGGPAEFTLPMPVRVLYGFGAIQDAAQKIDHALPPAKPVASGVTVEHGAYVANMCIGCHGPGLSGGKIPGGPPDWPAAANLTPGEGSVMGQYGDVKVFAAMFKSGKRPDGATVRVMPFESLRELSDVDVQALHVFLKSLPARAAGNR